MKKKLISLGLAGVLCFCLGCSTTWLTTFEGYLKIAGPILVEILSIVSEAEGTPLNAPLVTKINNDSAALNQIAASVAGATAQDIQGACAQFNVAVGTLDQDLQSIETIANIGPSTSAQISTSLSIAQGVFDEIEAPIAACQSAASPEAATARLQAAAVNVPSASNFTRAFNAVAGPTHQVHAHSKFVRIIS